MKKHIIFILLAILVLCFSSCDFNVDAPDIVTIEGKEYKKSFVDNLYLSYELISGEGIMVSKNRYYKYSLTPYDCYVTYNRDIYFAKNNFDEAMLYYSEPNNFNFLCLFGNAIDPNEQRIIKLENINCEIFNSLVKFSKDNAYNPLALFKDEKNLIKIPVADPDDWIAAEIHFYKNHTAVKLGY